MFGRTPIALLALLIATVAIVAACGNSGESVVAQPTALAPQDEIIPITAPADGEDHDHDAHAHDDEPTAPSGGVAVPAAFITTCGICHKVEGTGAAGVVGPELTHIGTIASTRTDIGAEAYIRQSIEDPTAFLAPGFGPVMPGGLDGALGGDFDAVVAYLVSLQ
jgi:cytochrome c1